MTATHLRRRTGRAAPMAPDERRRAIVDAVVPLLLESGGDVTTRQIAEAAGIAEGTIFRVFPDKPALLMAAAEETINPADGRADLDGRARRRRRAARPGARSPTERLAARSEQVMAVMMALRRIWMSQPPGSRERRRPDPPKFVRRGQRGAARAGSTERLRAAPRRARRRPRTAAAACCAPWCSARRHPGVDPRRPAHPRRRSPTRCSTAIRADRREG